MANQGIMHLSIKRGGKPYCGTRRAIMSTTEEHAKDWPRICSKCETIRLRYEAKRSA